jgi:hypothetical protein
VTIIVMTGMASGSTGCITSSIVTRIEAMIETTAVTATAVATEPGRAQTHCAGVDQF